MRCHATRVFNTTEHRTRDGRVINRQEATISDESNSIELILYGNDVGSLIEGKSYISKNIRLNIFNDRAYLNTTSSERQFEAVETDEIKEIDLSATSEITMMAKIIGINSIKMNFFVSHATKC